MSNISTYVTSHFHLVNLARSKPTNATIMNNLLEYLGSKQTIPERTWPRPLPDSLRIRIPMLEAEPGIRPWQTWDGCVIILLVVPKTIVSESDSDIAHLVATVKFVASKPARHRRTQKASGNIWICYLCSVTPYKEILFVSAFKKQSNLEPIIQNCLIFNCQIKHWVWILEEFSKILYTVIAVKTLLSC